MSKHDNNDELRRQLDVSNKTGQLNRVYDRDGGICQICFQPCNRSEASRDHIKELRFCNKEEARDDNNIRLAHVDCNNKRSNVLNMDETTLRLTKMEPKPLTQTMEEQLRALGFDLSCRSD